MNLLTKISQKSIEIANSKFLSLYNQTYYDYKKIRLHSSIVMVINNSDKQF